MRLTTKSQYGLLVLADLVRNFKPTGSPYRQLSELSEMTGTSVKYLEQILLPLTHSGIVESKRGANGGYRLRQSPEKVSLAEALRLLDGRLMPIPRWIEEAKSSETDDSRSQLSAFGDVVYRIRDAIRTILESHKLNVLAEIGDDLTNSKQIKEDIESLTYYI